MNLRLNRQSRTPLYLQIRNQLRELIVSHTLDSGFRLPSERKLASALGVNRSTVINAYRELEADGLVESHVGRGTTVRPLAVKNETQEADREFQSLIWKHYYNRQASRMLNPLISNLMDLIARKDIISFAVGMPAPESYPVTEFEKIVSELIKTSGYSLFEHGPTAGYYPLREYIAGLMKEKGFWAEPENIIIISGSQQGLDLMAKVFLEPGDIVVVEEPSYLGAIQVFAAAGARVLGVPVDEEGLRTDILQQVLSQYRPKFIYTLPTFQNPSGVTMSPSRRKELLDLAYNYHLPVLEDDPYGELYYEGSPVAPLKSLDNREHVIYLSTFSKVLFPGLRLGWMVAPLSLARQLVMAKQLDDLHTNSLSQWAIYEFCKKGLLAEHLMKMRQENAVKRNIMLRCLEENAPAGLKWNKPEGGFYLWCELPDGVNAGALLKRAIEKNVSFLPGDAFYAQEGGHDRIRLSFVRQPVGAISEGIKRICAALAEINGQAKYIIPETRPIV